MSAARGAPGQALEVRLEQDDALAFQVERARDARMQPADRRERRTVDERAQGVGGMEQRIADPAAGRAFAGLGPSQRAGVFEQLLDRGLRVGESRARRARRLPARVEHRTEQEPRDTPLLARRAVLLRVGLAELEQAHGVGAAAQVVLGVLEQPRQQRRPHHRPVLGQRIVDARQAFGGQPRGGERLLGEQVVVVRLGKTQRRKPRTDAPRGGLDGSQSRRARRQRREPVRDLVVAEEAADFFRKVVGRRQVSPPGRRAKRDRVAVLSELGGDRFERARDVGCGELRAEKGVDARDGRLDRRIFRARRRGLGGLRSGAARGLQDERSRARGGLARERGVDAALEAV